MDINELRGTTILLFGKPRSFEMSEFLAELSHHNITLAKSYESKVSLIVEGKMISPPHQAICDDLYKQNEAPFVGIDELEKLLAKHIDPKTLLMSLKLSNNRSRVVAFLKNRSISDELFLDLLRLYDWGEEDFFESDDNRDVSASIILRFYKNIETNHNVQYATTGLVHLLAGELSSSVIDAIYSLKPLRLTSNASLRHIIAAHPSTDERIILDLASSADEKMLLMLLSRSDLTLKAQQKLFDLGFVSELSRYAHLDIDLAKKMLLLPDLASSVASHITLDDELFKTLQANFSIFLASNVSLTPAMQRDLLEDTKALLDLAKNPALSEDIARELHKTNNEQIIKHLASNTATPQDLLELVAKDGTFDEALSSNSSTPPHILELLYTRSNSTSLINLARNTATPIEILYQLFLDPKLAKEVKQNKSFAKHIRSQELGW